MSATGAMYGAMGISSVSSLVAGYSESQAFKAQGRYEETIANTNAAMADLAEEQTLETGDAVASRKNLETNARVGSELAQQGASGVDVGSGSAALVRGGTKLSGQLDELTIRHNAARAAWGYKVQGINDRFQGRFARLTADARSKQALLKGGLQAIERPLMIAASYKSASARGGTIPNTYLPSEVNV